MLYHDELSEWRSDQSLDPTERHRIERAIALGAWGLAAVPYFLPVNSAVGITGSHPPDGELLDELRLPFARVAVYFGGDLTIPTGLIGADDTLITVAARTNEAYRRGIRRIRADDLPPTSLNNAQIALARGEEVRVAGVALHADDTGRLGDLALWFTVTPSDPVHPRRLTPGLLPRAQARPLVLNLAAALAWGDWDPPPADLDLPSDPASPGFLRQVRRGQFRRREPLGAAAGVRVLDVRRMNRLAADAGGTDASPSTHLRRGHWRRQRVGPRSDWRYERRYIPPVVVNPGATDQAITVYRLPTPPD